MFFALCVCESAVLRLFVGCFLFICFVFSLFNGFNADACQFAAQSNICRFCVCVFFVVVVVVVAFYMVNVFVCERAYVNWDLGKIVIFMWNWVKLDAVVPHCTSATHTFQLCVVWNRKKEPEHRIRLTRMLNLCWFFRSFV